MTAMERSFGAETQVPQELAELLPRDAADSDLAAVQAIYAVHVERGSGTFEETAPNVDEIRQRFDIIRARGLPFLVAGNKGHIEGFAYAAPFRERSAYRFTVEDSVYVHPDAMGRGIGCHLLGRLVEQCTDLGYRQMVAVIGDSANQRSIRLHEKLGFASTGILTAVGYKFGRWLDVVFMQRGLGEGSTRDP